MKMKPIEYDEESFWPVLVIKEGRPYRLTKLVRKDINDPCKLCDLRDECNYPDRVANYVGLCRSDDRDDGWFFAEDWMIADKKIAEFVTDESTFK